MTGSDSSHPSPVSSPVVRRAFNNLDFLISCKLHSLSILVWFTLSPLPLAISVSFHSPPVSNLLPPAPASLLLWLTTSCFSLVLSFTPFSCPQSFPAACPLLLVFSLSPLLPVDLLLLAPLTHLF